ncbi:MULTISPECIES: DUF1772 domain-containing protein [unclassified Variovorax]|uniref:anthrone oxygenase family protein n=1 Tax=unclassified Variovorax TaxID=663243 RepID=UPI003ECD7179
MATLNALMLPLTVLAAVGSAVIAGLLFAFSTSVMKALSQLPPEQGMAAMQNINVTIQNPVFLGVFAGTALLCAVLVLRALLHANDAATWWLVVGAAAYLIGTFGVTMVFNVPMNNTLARAEASEAVAAVQWPAYVGPWVRWNHLRTVMGVLAALSFTVAAVQWARAGASGA